MQAERRLVNSSKLEPTAQQEVEWKKRESLLAHYHAAALLVF